ncbi:MAG: putative quinol monooxygenase [Planctomycetota bacterium]
MSKLTIVASITANPGQEEFVLSELQGLVSPTVSEDGCLQYDLHQDNENPAHFLFYENWASRELWQNHTNSAHIQAYRERTKDAIKEIKLFEMTLVSPG